MAPEPFPSRRPMADQNGGHGACVSIGIEKEPRIGVEKGL